MADESKAITIKIKSTSRTYDITVPGGDNATVSEIKDIIVQHEENATKPQICLIFSGKILKDDETLDSHKIGDGMAIHLVIRQNKVPGAAATTPAPAIQPIATTAAAAPVTSTPSSTSSTNVQSTGSSQGTGNRLFGLGSGSGPGIGNPQNMAQQMMQNPEMMRQMMDSPIMQSIMGNPDIMRSMLSNNPQIQGLIERNPEIGHVLNDPEIMRQTMEMIRNPNMFQEMMRNHDLAIRNLQGIPGGEAALQRLYQDIQEPLLNSAHPLGGNPFASSGNAEDNSAASRSQRAGMENSEALPNPWGGSSTGRPNSNSANTSSNINSTADAGAGAGTLGDMFNAPSMNNVMQQMMSNPSQLSSLINPEMMAMLNQHMQQNPQLIQQMLESNPLVSGNPAVAEQMRSQMPQLLNMLSRPEIMTAMSNPRVLEAMRQIQQGVETLRREAPELARVAFAGAGSVPGTGSGTTSAPTSGPQSANVGVDAISGGMNPDVFNMVNNMISGMNLSDTNSNPEEAYAAQLEQLANMGFTNRAQNIAALRATFGDVTAAIERLLNSP